MNRYRSQTREVVNRNTVVMYLLDPANRLLSNFFLPKKLDRYLSKWIGKGIYNAVFDNVEDKPYSGQSAECETVKGNSLKGSSRAVFA